MFNKLIGTMKVSEELMNAAVETLDNNQSKMNAELSAINSIGCFGCGLGCSGTVGG